MKKKYLLTLLLAVSMTAMLVSGCGENKKVETKVESSETVEEEAAEDTEDVKKEDAEKKSRIAENKEETEEAKEETTDFEEVVVTDNDACTIRLTDIKMARDVNDMEISAFLENKSADKNYMFTVETASINGVNIYCGFASELPAGKKSKEAVTFYDELPMDINIGSFSDIALSFLVYDSDDYAADPVAKETVHIYPEGEEKATVYRRTDESSDQVLVDNDKVKVSVIGFAKNKYDESGMVVYMENKTDTTTMFGVDDVSVNGMMVDPYWAAELGAGQTGFNFISWDKSDLESNDITDIEEVEMKLHAYDSEDFTSDYYIEETYTVKNE